MRKELQDYEMYFWGLAVEDIEHTTDLVKRYFESFYKSVELPEISIYNPEIDLYLASHYREAQFLIQFGIWRIQSIFESLLTTEFNIKKANGLKSILKKLKKCGFVIVEEAELDTWILLRNKLSHSAPEIFNPMPTNFTIEDIKEYSSLITRIYRNLESQKLNKII